MAKNVISKIVTGSCPKCGEGKMWSHSAYKFSKMTKMNKKCSHCKTSFEPEPSFYTGALYVGYAFTVAIVLTVFFGAHILFEEPNINLMFLVVMIVIIIFAPLSLRLSRNVWANIFIK